NAKGEVNLNSLPPLLKTGLAGRLERNLVRQSQLRCARLPCRRLWCFHLGCLFVGGVSAIMLGVVCTRLRRPHDSVAVSVSALVVGRLWIALGQTVIPHASAALGAVHSIDVRKRVRFFHRVHVIRRHRGAAQLSSATTVSALVSGCRILDRLGVPAVAINFDPVLLVRVQLVSNPEPYRCTLERIGRGLLVVAAGSDVLTDHAEYLQPRLERAHRIRIDLGAVDLRQHLESQVPLARDHGVEALPHRVRFDVAHEAREVTSVAGDRLSVLAPRDRSGRYRRSQRRPYSVLRIECFLSRNHFRFLALVVPELLGLGAFALIVRTTFRTSATALQLAPCSQYQPYRSQYTRCSVASLSRLSHTFHSSVTVVSGPHCNHGLSGSSS